MYSLIFLLCKSYCSLCENFKGAAAKFIVKNYSLKGKDTFCLGSPIATAMEQTSTELVWTQALYYITGVKDF